MWARLLAALAALGVFLAIIVPLWLGHGAAPEQSVAAPMPGTPAASAESAALREMPTASPPSPAAGAPAADRPGTEPPAADLQLQQFAERRHFHERARTFFARAPALSAREKREQAQALAQELTRYEAALEITAAEALLLRTALLRESITDPVAQKAEIEALRERYREESERKQAEWQQRYDPEFESYKAREREIIAEVMAMTEFPDGLSREEYLRRRLQSAREQIYGQ